MQLNRTNIFIVISTIALLAVLIIQVNWIFQTAKIKEEIFNERANMVLLRTTEAISSDKETCRKIGDSVDNDSNFGSAAKLGKNEGRKIDSLFNHYMKYYNFHINYSYEVKKSNPDITAAENRITNYSYNKTLEDAGNDGVELKLIVPEKRQFIIAEMGTLFITSVILILVVLIMFWRTILLLIREKKISEHTTDFLNNMTHEFKTPLTNIALAGKMIIKDSTVKQDSKIKHYSEIILEENEKLRLQVEQVLSMTALERGEIPLLKTEIDFHELINNSVKYISIQIENNKGNIKLNLNADRFMVFGDKTHLTNALCNLIDNSIKYSLEKLEITIQTSNIGHHLIVKISDNGIGIEKEYQKKVFDKFFRVPTGDVHDVKGFGLGLAYIKKIVELHNGTIDLQSEIAKKLSAEKLAATGTTFTIALPYD